ncbi:transcriptional regulator, LysR family [Devosia sp. YR412]|uniref:hydrogen peroxide-inducible genes activator n=1 Tax=Devosia sp. YR412 TaxID=1881030 RepID=UPI0008B38305|nr:hydrogen peroxide-inducible genes activator [Devosia sp. YR412]SEQ01878.1 transcriptional regulator, LysR family [Devosia sp. YR412]
MHLSLKQMRYAVAVAETGHFGRAAKACNISQPALSQQVQAIEELCGTPLFDRLKAGVRPTPFGLEFVSRARQVLDSADALSAFTLGHAGEPDRPIRFGLIPTVAPYLLPEIFPALTAGLPGLDFTVSENRTDALMAGLVEGSLDVALIGTEAPEQGPKLVSRSLFEDPFVLATSLSETTSTPVSLASLAPERILLLDEGHCFRDQTIAACRLDSDPSARTFAATSLSTIVEFVANGQGVTLLPRIALRKEASDPRIAIHDLGAPGAGRLLSLVWREATPFGATFDKMAEVIRSLYPAASPSGR